MKLSWHIARMGQVDLSDLLISLRAMQSQYKEVLKEAEIPIGHPEAQLEISWIGQGSLKIRFCTKH